MNEPREYRHAKSTIIVTIVAALIMFGFILFAYSSTQDIFLGLFFFLIIGLLLYSSFSTATSVVTISETEISTRRFGIAHTLGWSEIARASMRGQNLRLQNEDHSISLVIDSQLSAYEEILDIVLAKRADLFDPNEENQRSAGFMSSLLGSILWLALVAAAVAAILSNESSIIFGIILLVLGLFALWSWLVSPKDIRVDGNMVVVKYLFREDSFPRDDVLDIMLGRQRTRTGTVYYVSLALRDRKPMRISSPCGSVLTYLIIKRWYSKAASLNTSSFSWQ